MIEAIRRAARDHSVSCSVQGDGTMFQVMFSADGLPPQNYREMIATDAARYARFQAELLRRGVLANATRTACWFLSTDHSDDDIAEICEAVEGAFAALE